MKVGFVGLGAMGESMARNISQGGYLAAVWNRTLKPADRIGQELQVYVAKSLADLAGQVDIVLCCVSADSDVLQVIDGLLPGLDAESTVVDLSTVSRKTAIAAQQTLAEIGAAFLDSPVSGGIEGARNGCLAMMVGGDKRDLERVRPVLQTMGSRIVHMGPVGAGQAAKAVNQIMAAGINQAVTEALAFGACEGLPMEQLIGAISAGAAGNWFLDHRGPSMVAGLFDPGFKVALHHKDLLICQQMAHQQGREYGVINQTLSDYRLLLDGGYGDQDISALFRLKRPE